MRSAYMPLPARIALVGIVAAVPIWVLVGLVGGDLGFFLAGIWNFPGAAKKVTVPGVPEPARWTEMRAGEAMPYSRCSHSFKPG